MKLFGRPQQERTNSDIIEIMNLIKLGKHNDLTAKTITISENVRQRIDNYIVRSKDSMDGKEHLMGMELVQTIPDIQIEFEK